MGMSWELDENTLGTGKKKKKKTYPIPPKLKKKN